MKTLKKQKMMFAGIALGCLFLVLPAQAQNQNSAAARQLDLNLHYNLQPKIEDQNISPAKRDVATPKLMGVVTEQRDTSPSLNRLLFNPYHRTVSTGLTF